MAIERKKILLRLDPAVHDALTRWAGDEMRSTNAQIEFLLRRALRDGGRLPTDVPGLRGPGRPPAIRETALQDTQVHDAIQDDVADDESTDEAAAGWPPGRE